MKEISVKSGERSGAIGVGPLCSQARHSPKTSFTLLTVPRSGLDYQRRMAIKDRSIVVIMRQYSEQYPRYGARRIRIFLRRNGLVLGRNRTAHIWPGAGLQVPAKRTRKRYRTQNRQ